MLTARLKKISLILLNEATGSQGSGRDWYGDPFNPVRERTYNDFSFPNIITSEAATLRVRFAARGRTSSSMTASIAGQNFSTSFTQVNWTDNEASYARNKVLEGTFTPSGSNLSVNISYPAVGDGTNIGWIDYIELNVRRQLKMEGSQFAFRDQKNDGLWNFNIPTH